MMDHSDAFLPPDHYYVSNPGFNHGGPSTSQSFDQELMKVSPTFPPLGPHRRNGSLWLLAGRYRSKRIAE